VKEGASQVVFVCIFSVYSKTATTTLFACTKYFRGTIFRSNFSFSQLYFWLFYIVSSPLFAFVFYFISFLFERRLSSLSEDFSSFFGWTFLCNPLGKIVLVQFIFGKFQRLIGFSLF